jgi:hypothetical protein
MNKSKVWEPHESKKKHATKKVPNGGWHQQRMLQAFLQSNPETPETVSQTSAETVPSETP